MMGGEQRVKQCTKIESLKNQPPDDDDGLGKTKQAS